MNKTFTTLPGTRTIGNYIVGIDYLMKEKILVREHSEKLRWVYIAKPKKKLQ